VYTGEHGAKVISGAKLLPEITLDLMMISYIKHNMDLTSHSSAFEKTQSASKKFVFLLSYEFYLVSNRIYFNRFVY